METTENLGLNRSRSKTSHLQIPAPSTSISSPFPVSLLLFPSFPYSPFSKYQHQVAQSDRKRILASIEQIRPIFARSEGDVKPGDEETDNSTEFHQGELFPDAAEWT